ncbi:MAG: imidazole glycerol phosphate synthase subunit HisH [Chitinophagales bacterium]|nr:MAG: imidazole glycerol phosphate synthase subunit HisH [Chitinophagales bacterium]
MVAVIKYNAGNIRSVMNALHRLNMPCVLTDDADVIQKAEKVIFPGVGHAGSAMQYLKEKNLHTLLPALKQPLLGICLGLQLMCSFSEEGPTEGLNIFPERVTHFPPAGKVPHMGWNSLRALKGPLFDGILENTDVYFVHSYYAECGPHTIAVTDYQVSFSAALQKDNFFAVQFHPEKSAHAGQHILKNFLKL